MRLATGRLGLVLAGAALAAAPPAHAALSAYVTNGNKKGADALSQFDLGAGGLLAPKSPATVAGGALPFAIVVSPDAKSAYTADNGPAGLSQFDIGAGGRLTAKSPMTATFAGAPFGLAISPDGRSVYVPDARTSGHVYQFDIKAGGHLAPKSPPSVATGSNPFGVAVSPDGRSVYVANSLSSGANGISQFDVGAGGTLSPKSPATVSGGIDPYFVAVTPDGTSVYVTNNGASSGANGVSQFDVGPGGRLTPKSPAALTTGPAPYGLAVSPDGRNVYVANQGSSGADGISQFDIGTGGHLMPKSPATVTTGDGPSAITLSPGGQSAYVTNYNTNGAGGLSQFNVGSGGLLQPKSPATVAGGDGPLWIALSPARAPTARFTVRTQPAGKRTGFDATGSSAPDGVVSRFDWIFGDGSSAANAGPRPTHRYEHTGKYLVTLTVTDSNGCSTRVVFTGQTAYCVGGPRAKLSHSVTITLVLRIIDTGGSVARLRSDHSFRLPGLVFPCPKAATATCHVRAMVTARSSPVFGGAGSEPVVASGSRVIKPGGRNRLHLRLNQQALQLLQGNGSWPLRARVTYSLAGSRSVTARKDFILVFGEPREDGD